ncbi:MAG: aspartyl protease family protein [Opitutaceae bacterium]|nr:aspartyl protease family protein [Opitutaceae bacterium]
MNPRVARLCLALGALWLLLAGCQIAPRETARPARTKLAAPLVVLPAETYGHVLIVTAAWDKHGPYHFLVDTGSSLTLVSPELAQRYRDENALPASAPPVRVRSANGETVTLPTTVITRLKLGDAQFERVPVGVFDCGTLSAHYGIKIDGVLGFSLFRDTRLTLDYPQSRLILAPARSALLVPGAVLPTQAGANLPIISVRLGDREIPVLVDSGSDATLNLDPAGLTLRYRAEPRPVALVGTLTGDQTQTGTRLEADLQIGPYSVPTPIVYLNDSLSSLGGGLLRHFSVTFDPLWHRVVFHRESRTPLTVPSLRGTGLGFSKTPAYWRVAGVVPNSPASQAGVRKGELVSRINGEAVAQWSFQRYERLIAEADRVTYTFLRGTEESDRELPVFLLVP